MVGKRILKIHELKNLDEYFKHILLNEINGNRSDVRELIQDLSRSQKQSFLSFLENESGNDAQICKELTIKSI